jgi:hypothetical protein
MQEAMLEHVKAGTYQVFDGDENTRHRMDFSFLKMCGLPEHESRANSVDCTLISRFSTRKGACQIMLKMPILRTDDPSSQHNRSGEQYLIHFPLGFYKGTTTSQFYSSCRDGRHLDCLAVWK